MKKLAFFLFIILVPISAKAQFALKGGISYAKNEVSNYVVTGQFYQDLLVLSADLYMPTEKIDNLSGSGRIGFGFGDYRIRFAGDLVAMYEDKHWRCGCGVEANLRLSGPIGAFVRWGRTFPIEKDGDHDEVIWRNGRSELSLGIVIDLTRRCY